jgi:hypothetical protein
VARAKKKTHLWQMADALRNNMDAAEYKHAELAKQKAEGADPEDKDEYRAANVTIDWTIRDNVRAQLRVLVKRILRKYGYPPDKQAKATETVLEQAEVLSEAWSVA